MPHIKFTDTNIGAIPTPDKTVWYTDPKQKGLRLCVTKTGVKTWYVNKWDPTANKVRSVKLGQWASKVNAILLGPLRQRHLLADRFMRNLGFEFSLIKTAFSLPGSGSNGSFVSSFRIVTFVMRSTLTAGPNFREHLSSGRSRRS
ncbi:hypothetical protein ACJ5NV_19190 [Loktanella agnita]|uniref:hypothetical protein n=1 Tax=Loktanella agnita TaxID=287097 RepID=UPI0039894F73